LSVDSADNLTVVDLSLDNFSPDAITAGFFWELLWGTLWLIRSKSGENKTCQSAFIVLLYKNGNIRKN
jgi:hypothetical protein